MDRRQFLGTAAAALGGRISAAGNAHSFPFWENLVKPPKSPILGQLTDSMGEIKWANVAGILYAE